MSEKIIEFRKKYENFEELLRSPEYRLSSTQLIKLIENKTFRVRKLKDEYLDEVEYTHATHEILEKDVKAWREKHNKRTSKRKLFIRFDYSNRTWKLFTNDKQFLSGRKLNVAQLVNVPVKVKISFIEEDKNGQ